MNITELCAGLKLSYIRDNWQQFADEAIRTNINYAEFLECLLEGEWKS